MWQWMRLRPETHSFPGHRMQNRLAACMHSTHPKSMHCAPCRPSRGRTQPACTLQRRRKLRRALSGRCTSGRTSSAAMRASISWQRVARAPSSQISIRSRRFVVHRRLETRACMNPCLFAAACAPGTSACVMLWGLLPVAGGSSAPANLGVV